MSSQSSRLRAIRLYKELHRVGREYPDPGYDFIGKIQRGFRRNAHLTGQEAEKALQLGEYIKRETIALYALKKYRHLKRAYPSMAETMGADERLRSTMEKVDGDGGRSST